MPLRLIPITSLLVAAALSIAPAAAREFTAEEKAGLAEAVAAFDTAMVDGDFATIVETIPPKVFENIASGAGIEVDALRDLVIEQMEESLKVVTIDEFGMDLDAAQYLETADGTPYALIPSVTVVNTNSDAGSIKVSSSTFAFIDEDVWYLMSVDQAQQIGILKAVYPSFADVDFPQPTTEAVQ